MSIQIKARTKNRALFDTINKLVKESKREKTSKKDGVLVLSIHLRRENNEEAKSDAAVFMNGFSLDELDVLIRDVYSKIYEMRVRNQKNMQEVDAKLTKIKLNQPNEEKK